MAEVVLHPDPQSFPPGTSVKVYERALPEAGQLAGGQPPGAQITEPTVAANGTLTVTGVLTGHRYVGWAVTGGVDRYLFFALEPAATGGGGAEGALLIVNDLSELTATAATARTNIGLGTAATHPATDFATAAEVAGKLAAANNLSELAASAATARGNIGAAPVVSPALTGTPTAPTAAALTNTTQLATTAYADAAVAVEKSRAQTAEGLALAKAANLSDLANAGESRMNLRTPIVASATAVSTANVASLEGLPTVDGVALEAGQTVLLTAQTEAKNNGPWVVAVGAWTRPNDFATGFVLKASRLIAVVRGTANKLTLWILTTTGEVMIGTTAHAWEKVPTGGGAGEIEWHPLEELNANLTSLSAAWGVLNGVLYLVGELEVKAEVVNGTVAFKLPVGARPEHEQRAAVVTGGSSFIGAATVKTTGEVIAGKWPITSSPLTLNGVLRLK